MSAAFTAQYADTCRACEGHIKKGDAVLYGAFAELVHVKCPDPLELVRPTCPSCFTELPVSGVCGVCS